MSSSWRTNTNIKVFKVKSTHFSNYLQSLNSKKNEPKEITKTPTIDNCIPSLKETKKRKPEIIPLKIQPSLKKAKYIPQQNNQNKNVEQIILTSKKSLKKPIIHPIYKISDFPSVELPKKITDECELNRLDDKPFWMKNGILIEQKSDNLSLNCLNIDIRLHSILKTEGYTKYLPVQKAVIPSIIRGYILKRDILICSPTGSGKTLAYVLPLLHLLCKYHSFSNAKQLRAIIILPSRDLALQIFLEVNKFCQTLHLLTGLCNGSKSLREEERMLINNQLSDYCSHFCKSVDGKNEKCSKIDILVCTPGRLCHHLDHTPGFTLKYLQFLVMDECDKLTKEGSFQDWLFRVNHALTNGAMDDAKHVLKILVSATLTHNPKILSLLHLQRPIYLGSSVSKKYVLPMNLFQYFILSDERNKYAYFLSLIEMLFEEKLSAVCFCDSVNTVHRLRRMIEISLIGMKELNFQVFEFSRKIQQKQRTFALKKFQAKQIQFIICSDALSRGLDIACLDCVINYECPRLVETYVHRIGRTARASNEGRSYTFVSHAQKLKLRNTILPDIDNGRVHFDRFYVNAKYVKQHRASFEAYMEQMSDVLEREQQLELEYVQSLRFV